MSDKRPEEATRIEERPTGEDFDRLLADVVMRARIYGFQGPAPFLEEFADIKSWVEYVDGRFLDFSGLKDYLRKFLSGQTPPGEITAEECREYILSPPGIALDMLRNVRAFCRGLTEVLPEEFYRRQSFHPERMRPLDRLLRERKWVWTRTAAKRLDLSPRWIRELVKKERLRLYEGRPGRIETSSILEYLKEEGLPIYF